MIVIVDLLFDNFLRKTIIQKKYFLRIYFVDVLPDQAKEKIHQEFFQIPWLLYPYKPYENLFNTKKNNFLTPTKPTCFNPLSIISCTAQLNKL